MRAKHPAGINTKWFDRPFDRLTVLSRVEGLTILSELEGQSANPKFKCSKRV